MTVDEAIAELKQAGGNYTCRKMVRLLRSLGFEIRDGKRTPNHKIVKHPDLLDFPGSDFNCPHRSGVGILKPYVRKILSMLEAWKDELEKVQ